MFSCIDTKRLKHSQEGENDCPAVPHEERRMDKHNNTSPTDWGKVPLDNPHNYEADVDEEEGEGESEGIVMVTGTHWPGKTGA